jgi:trk system potassium uptake protein TrkA
MQRFAVIGLGRFGQRLAQVLTADGAEVLAIDRDARLVEAARDEVTLAVRLDSTDAEALKAQGVADVDAAIVGIGEAFESAALTVAVLKSLGVPQIYARAETDIQAQILRSIGADAIINPERESALRWAHRFALPNLREYVELGEDHALVHAAAPAAFCHKTLIELQLRQKYGLNLVAIQREVRVQKGTDDRSASRSVVTVPQADTAILPNDVLILVGSNEALSRLPTD